MRFGGACPFIPSASRRLVSSRDGQMRDGTDTGTFPSPPCSADGSTFAQYDDRASGDAVRFAQLEVHEPADELESSVDLYRQQELLREEGFPGERTFQRKFLAVVVYVEDHVLDAGLFYWIDQLRPVRPPAL